MSSDSEDDCYGNVAQKLNSIKIKIFQDQIKPTSVLDDSLNVKPNSIINVDSPIKIAKIGVRKDYEVLANDSEVEEISLDDIIAKNSKKRVCRRAKRNADISIDNIIPAKTRKGNTKKSRSKKISESVATSAESNTAAQSDISTGNTTVNYSRGKRGRKRGRGRGNSSAIDTNVNNSVSTQNMPAVSSNPSSQADNHDSLNESDLFSMFNMARGRNRRGRRQDNSRRSQRMRLPAISTLADMVSSIQSQYPTYSVGNTDEYPDECYNQALFTKAPDDSDIVEVLDNEAQNDSLDENEELSVKVYWQNSECVKFTIRRFQKIKQIFDFFANRENVSHDKLLFTYNDKILTMGDTPDSITYSIVKFIDGGVIKQSVSKIGLKDTVTALKDGIKVKFQCQDVKKPFEISIRNTDKISVAMMMCAEHLEKPLEKLKFYFDGEILSGKKTPLELEFEGGECIDVKIIS